MLKKINCLKSPNILINKFWQSVNKTIEKDFFCVSLLITFNFMPYVYLFSLYSQYQNAIGGFFKPFSDIVLIVMIINLLPNKCSFYLKNIILCLSATLSLMELFIINKYYTFTTAGIVSVIIGTNFNESIEFIKMYMSLEYILFIVLLGGMIYLLKKVSKKIKIPHLIKLTIPFFFIYSLSYTVLPHKNIIECLTFSRLTLPTVQAVEDLMAFNDIYKNMNNDVQITKNNSDIPNVVIILGESTNKNHMSLYGYQLKTTPKLDELAKNNEIYVFKDVISSHAYTIGSIREMFTFHNYEATDKWYKYSNLFDIVNKAGYTTYWLSNQETSGQWANVALAFANRCTYKEFTGVRQSYEQSYRADGELLPLIYKAINNNNDKNFYLIHLMGTHGDYENRYTEDFNKFSASDEKNGSKEENEIIAKYDNAILYNDTIVVQIMNIFKDKDAIVIYVPDHGEEVYDTKEFKGHSDDNYTKSMLEIPFIIYTTKIFKEKYPILDNNIKNAVNKPYMTDDFIHTVLDIMNIETKEYQMTRSIINPYFNQDRKRIFLEKDYDKEIR